MSLKIDRLQLEIIIDNDQARKSLRGLEDEMNKLKQEMRKVPEGSKEWNDMNTRLKTMKQQHDNIIESIGIHGLSLKELAQRQKELNLMMRNMDPRLPEYKKLEQQYREITTRQTELRNGTRQTQSAFSRLADSFNKYQALAMGFVAATAGVVLGLKQMLEGAAKFSDALADVRKTTGLTDVEVKKLSQSLGELNTRSSRQELLELARIGGKLGITGLDNILGFVKAADQINVALSEDLGGNAEEAIAKVGKLVDVFKVGDQYGMEQGLLKVGSAINSLGAASTANEEYLIEFGKRLGGVATQAGISVQDVLGLGAALDQLGQTTEVSSTALSKLVVDMFKDTGKYAEIAGMNVSEFTNLLNTNANEAFLKLLEGLNGNNEGLSVMAQKLDDLGADGSRSVGVLATLAQNTQLVREQQQLSNQEFEKGTSLTQEFNVKNETLGATLDKIGKVLHSMFISSGLMEGLGSLARGFLSLIGNTQKLSDESLKTKDKVNMLVIELTNANTQQERKKDIWTQLQQIAPGVLKNLDQENISTSQLAENLKKYNDQMIKKIALQDSEELLGKKREAAGKAAGTRVDKEAELMLELSTFQQKADNVDPAKSAQMRNVMASNLDLNAKSMEMIKIAQEINEQYGQLTITTGKAVLITRDIAAAKKEEKQAFEDVEEALKSYTDRYKLLMGVQSTNGDMTTPTSTGTSTTSTSSDSGTTIIPTSGGGNSKFEVPHINFFAIDKEFQEKINKATLDFENALTLSLDKQGEDTMNSVVNQVIAEAESLHELMNSFAEEEDPFLSKIDERQQKLDLFFAKGKISQEQYNQMSKKLAKEKADYETKIEKQLAITKLSIMSDVLGQASSQFKEHTAAFKILASAQALINTYLSATQAYSALVGMGPMGPVLAAIAAGVAIATGLANVAKINAVQFASGKYDVIGASDGRTYQAEYMPRSRTGIYSRPTLVGGLGLVGERAPELVVDGPTLSNIQMNAPEIIQAIHAMRVPQHAVGNYPEVGQSSSKSFKTVQPDDSLTGLLREISAKLDNPTRAKIVWSDWDDANTEVENIKNSVSK